MHYQNNASDNKTVKRARGQATAATRQSRLIDNEDLGDFKYQERATVKGRLAEELRSRGDDRLNHSTNVSDVHLAEKGRLATENADLLYKTDFHGN